VYPPKTKAAAMLEIYSQQFTTVEIDATYYRVLPASTFESMAQRTPAGFRFSAKLPSAGTHMPDAGQRAVHADVLELKRNLAPLIDAGKFACVLAQFPNSFHPNEATHTYLDMLRDSLDEIPLVAEFRHREWQTHETLELLRRLQIGLVNVDEPHFRTLFRESSDVTSPIAYVRFHGRNAKTWWRGTNESRYDYLYAPQELEPWAQRVVDISANPEVREVLAFFNNHARGQAVKNAELFETMLTAVLPSGTVRTARADVDDLLTGVSQGDGDRPQ
jgi:uncharacterized protein YecE (DUF72 family)